MTGIKFALLAACLCAACGDAARAPLAAADVRLSAPRPGTPVSAAYLELSNPGTAPQTITAVTSPQYARVEIHETVIEDGVARMRKLPELVIAPHESVRFEPGGKHLMLMERLPGDGRITLEFWTQDALLLSVDADVESDGG
jgi:copper(I)-binding protein